MMFPLRPTSPLSFTFSFAAIVVSIIVPVSHARLGDTERQCVQRYGSAPRQEGLVVFQPVQLMKGVPTVEYHFQGFKIQTVSVGGVVVRQRYSRLKLTADSYRLTAKEVMAILQAESGGSAWKPGIMPHKPGITEAVAAAILTSTLGVQTWYRQSDQATCSVEPGGMAVVLDTSAARAHEAQTAQTAQNAKSGKGSPVPRF